MTYDSATIARLQWQYGMLETSAIIHGIDPSTNADLAAWRNLGGATVRVSRRERLDKARDMLKRGVPARKIAAETGLSIFAVNGLKGGPR